MKLRHDTAPIHVGIGTPLLRSRFCRVAYDDIQETCSEETSPTKIKRRVAGSHPLIRTGTTIPMMYGVGPYAKTTINKGVECIFEIRNERKESGAKESGLESAILQNSR